MGVYATHLRELAQQAGAILHASQASSGSVTTLVDSTYAGAFADDHFNGCLMYIFGGTAIGQERSITDYTGSTGTFTFVTGTAPDSTSTYLILRRGWQMSDMRQAFVSAMRRTRKRYLLPKVDDTVTIDLDTPTYEYNVPSGFVAIRHVLMEMTEGEADFVIELPADPFWYIEKTSTRQIVFNKLADYYLRDGHKLRLIGQQYDTEPASDASTITIQTAGIIMLAAAHVQLIHVPDDVDGTERRSQLAGQYEAMAWRTMPTEWSGVEWGSQMVEDA